MPSVVCAQCMCKDVKVSCTSWANARWLPISGTMYSPFPLRCGCKPVRFANAQTAARDVGVMSFWAPWHPGQAGQACIRALRGKSHSRQHAQGSGMMQFGRICLSIQNHAPQKVLAYAYKMHDLPGHSVCTQRPSSSWRCQTSVCKPFSNLVWAVILSVSNHQTTVPILVLTEARACILVTHRPLLSTCTNTQHCM